MKVRRKPSTLEIQVFTLRESEKVIFMSLLNDKPCYILHALIYFFKNPEV